MNTNIHQTEFERHAFVAPSPHGSVVRCDGEDTKSFLHRMSTQEINTIQNGNGTLNAYVNQKGRVVDISFHLQLEDHSALLLGQGKKGTDFIAWLEQFHFIEKIQLTDLSSEVQCAFLLGGQAGLLLEKVFGDNINLAPWQFTQQSDLLAIRVFDYSVDTEKAFAGYYLVDFSNKNNHLLELLKSHGGLPITQAQENDLRIHSGIPRAPHEINENITPLALALHDGISWTKGCYIGQEVIARMDTYDRITKNLALFSIEAPTPLSKGVKLWIDDKSVGEITSCTSSEKSAHQIALALLNVKGSQIAQANFHVKQADQSFTAKLLPRLAAQEPHD